MITWFALPPLGFVFCETLLFVAFVVVVRKHQNVREMSCFGLLSEKRAGLLMALSLRVIDPLVKAYAFSITIISSKWYFPVFLPMTLCLGGLGKGLTFKRDFSEKFHHLSNCLSLPAPP